uniref:RTTN_N domain-containing protein n=1 Tax=Macrostomum lignano TaxID=282301 RepID=A0A1I8FGI7_9PLAT
LRLTSGEAFPTSGQACPASDRALSGFWSGLSGFWSGLSASGRAVWLLVGLVRLLVGLVRLSGRVLSGFWSGLSAASGRALSGFLVGFCPASGRACPASGRASASGRLVGLLVGFCPGFWSGLSGFWSCLCCLPLSALPSNRAVMNGGTKQARAMLQEGCARAAASATTASATLGRPPSAVDALRKPPSLRCAADVAALAATFGQLRGFADFTRQAVGQLAEVALGGVVRADGDTASRRSRSSNFWCVRTCQRRGGGEPAGLPDGAAGGRRRLRRRRGLSNRRRRGKDRSAPWSFSEFWQRNPAALWSCSARTARCLLCVKSGRPQLARPTQQLQVATRGTPRGLLDQLTEPRCELTDPGPACPVAKRLLGAAGNQEEPERRTRAIRVLLAWAGSHFDDFAASPELFGVLLAARPAASGGRGGGGGGRAAAAAARLQHRIRPEPPLAAQGATAGNSVDELEPDDDIDQVDEGLQLRLRFLTSLPRRVELSAAAGTCCPTKTAAAVNDAMANDADEVDEVSASTMGFRLLEVSVAPGLVVRRRALAPSRPAADLACGVGGGGGGGGVRLYLAGPSEPADLFLASDAETRQLLAEVELESASPSGVGQRNGPLFEYFLAVS